MLKFSLYDKLYRRNRIFKVVHIFCCTTFFYI
nr:MAG TPA: hypothetical protein [Caudoviricetes sp.]